ncbi:MAG: biotin--[Thermoguttaceae bacterium]|nr:biotin--[acetyl-CoA-carboxylase] ligase [Thermoguttaceae bacterium]MBR4103993.1 biotin--[acetyl-CoA-carboxylase] ligase [Thermoguttaceae bacterium]
MERKETQRINAEEIARRAEIAGALWLETVGSTNDRAKDWIRTANASPQTPFWIGAERQTSGRGRGEHVWAAWEGALTFSLIARWRDFRLTRRESAELSLRVANAVASTAREFAPSAEIWVKPPNDVYVRDRKLAGILIESPNAEFVVVGVGVNVGNRSTEAPPELRERVVSLAEAVDANDGADRKTESAFDVDAIRAEFAIRVVRRILGRDVE